MPSIAANGTSWNGRSLSSASSSEMRSPDQAVTGIPCPTVGETVSVPSGNGCPLTQLSSTSDRDGNGPGSTNTETFELGTHASFRPVNMGSRPGSGAVDVSAHASITVTTNPAVNSDKLGTRKRDSGPTGHAATADSDGHVFLGMTRGNSVPGPQIATCDQRDGGVARSDLPDEPTEEIPSSQSQYEHHYLSASVPESEQRTVADAIGPFRPQPSNTNRSQNLSHLNSHISAAQQIDYSCVQFAEAPQLESQSHEHHPYHSGTATPAGPTPSEKPNATIQSASKEKSTRSRTGCSACRKKRVKCDENSPTCMSALSFYLQEVVPPLARHHAASSKPC
jgi:hypothetical protein